MGAPNTERGAPADNGCFMAEPEGTYNFTCLPEAESFGLQTPL